MNRIVATIAALVALAGCFGATAHAGADPLLREIAAAKSGATVRVPVGIHHVHLVLGRPITLQGVPGAVLDGDGSGDVVRIASPDVVVRDLAIRHSGRSLTAMNAGVFIEGKASGALVEHDRISDSLFGVYIDGASRVKVLGNVVRGVASLRVADRGDGIHLWNDHDCLIQGNDVGPARDGIYFYVSPGNVFAGNRIHDVRYGMHDMYSNHVVIVGNRSYRNVAGYALMSSEYLDIRNNVAVDDSSYGFLLNYVTYSRFTGNRIADVVDRDDADSGIGAGMEGKGIFVYNSEFNRFQANDIADSTIGIHITAGSDHNEVFGNAFVGNRTQVKYDEFTALEWSHGERGNYWSNYLGWDMNGDGIGDVAYRPNSGVDVLLWKYPGARLLMSSPATLLLRYVQRAFPVFTPPGITDHFPLMREPRGR
ncbi:nitrous oxide reductase family maturation protein NosD [Thiomonas sp.]|uniref:nitrous oxide reductase family maturation protein NosD n=1 Tax=Thiomonas sp. TaxID=2047785 RepID=UPI00261A94C5|nr:nitrous oxide reductase family maturation protein NosD [Thiomonas sp.]